MTKPTKNNSQLLYLQARQLFEQARSKFEDGSIKTDALLIQSVFNSFQEFFTSMGKPNMVPRYAPEDGPPWSEDYNSMINEIRQDLELLFQEVDILGRSLYTDFNHNMVQHEILMSQYQSVLDKMRDLEIFSGMNGSGVDFGRDDFLSKDKIDFARIAGTPLEIVDGAVTLPQVSRINVAEQASITIVTGNRQQNKFILGTESNGFPGNNTEIHSVTDDVLTNRNYIPTFLGEEDNHGNYSTVLDGNPNTWFEYEKVNVREQDKIRGAKNLGWNYQVHENQTISWAEDPDDGILKLHMQIVLKEEEIINQINCNMYTPPNYGAKTAVVKNILVSGSSIGTPVSVMPRDKKDDQYNFHFPPVKAKVIDITFEQRQKYITDIGHIFYEKKMQAEDNTDYAMDMATRKYQYAPRIDGPLVSLEDLGISVKVSNSDVNADYPQLTSSSEQVTNIGETINRLLNNVDLETMDMGVEKFEGFRWCIGIRDIEIFSCEYAEEGELVTYPFYFENPLDKISLNVNENLPTALTGNESLKYEWLKYYVSIDDGAQWHPITPMSHQSVSEDQPPKIYTVHTIETSEQRLNDKASYLESEYPVYSLRLKIIGRRPSDYTTEGFMLKDGAGVTESFVQSSPIVSSYMLDILTKTEAFDSEASERSITSIDSLGEAKPDTGFNEPPATVPENPWGDDDGDGRPNWDDPDHPEYVSPDTRPPNYEPPGRPPGNTYPPGGIPTQVGGPHDDDDGDGIPNHQDPDWKPRLTVVITNKKTNWCADEDLYVRGYVYSKNNLKKTDFYVGGNLLETKEVSGRYADFEFMIPKNTHLPNVSISVIVRGYDTEGNTYDSDVINIIDCTGIPPEDKPYEQGSNKLNVVIDKRVSELCECDTLSFYGSIQGPNPIQTVIIRVNGTAIDLNNLGTPPANDPCIAGESSPVQVQASQVSVKQMTDEELLEIEDFGEWLNAFEEREDCGCRNKKKNRVAAFQMQSTPFSTMALNEEFFQADIPYWKLRELGVVVGQSFTVEVNAIDTSNTDEKKSFIVAVKDCENPETDEDGNPRVSDCNQLESVEVHYFNPRENLIKSETIPGNALPYEHIDNGMGSKITVGWRKDYKGPILMMTGGHDDSGYAFQVHAVAINYLDEFGQSKKVWAQGIAEKSAGVKNEDKMLGDASRETSWVSNIANGDYALSPSLGGINDYVSFTFLNEWNDKACLINMDFDPSVNQQPDAPEEDPDAQPLYDCATMTHILFQYYDDVSNLLKVLKIDISANGKDIYSIQTKNGNVDVAVGWVDYFKGPTIQIKSAAGNENVLLTAIGLVYQDIYGNSQTSWATQLRYRTNGVKNAEFAVGELKELTQISWLSNGVVSYEQATYIGRQNDMVAYRIDDTVTESLCAPEKPMDEEVGIDPENPPDVPSVTFDLTLPEICFDEETTTIIGTAIDAVGLKEVQYGVLLNGMQLIGPYTDEVSGYNHSVTYQLNPSEWQIGDTAQIYIEAKNLYGQTAMLTQDILVVNCEPPIVTQPCGVSTASGGHGVTTTMHQLGTEAGIVAIDYNMNNIPDTMDVYYQDQLITSTNGPIADSGTLTFHYEPVDNVYEIKIVVTGTDALTGWAYTVNCPVDSLPEPEEPVEEGTDEDAITNEYAILARLKWGGTPSDMDFHAFVDRDINKHLSYNAGGADGTNNIKASYTDADGIMYLNYDWTGHDSNEDYETEYEVITVNGFANKVITFLVHRFTANAQIDLSYPPTVEIVNQETGDIVHAITMPANEWTTDFMRAVEIQLDANGNFQSILRNNGSISALDPTL